MFSIHLCLGTRLKSLHCLSLIPFSLLVLARDIPPSPWQTVWLHFISEKKKPERSLCAKAEFSAVPNPSTNISAQVGHLTHRAESFCWSPGAQTNYLPTPPCCPLAKKANQGARLLSKHIYHTPASCSPHCPVLALSCLRHARPLR